MTLWNDKRTITTAYCASIRLANGQLMHQRIWKTAAIVHVIHILPYSDSNGSNLVVKKAKKIYLEMILDKRKFQKFSLFFLQ